MANRFTNGRPKTGHKINQVDSTKVFDRIELFSRYIFLDKKQDIKHQAYRIDLQLAMAVQLSMG